MTKDEIPDALYLKVANDGADDAIHIEDKLDALIEPEGTVRVAVYGLVEIREVKRPRTGG
jgi:hypothetical protein